MMLTSRRNARGKTVPDVIFRDCSRAAAFLRFCFIGGILHVLGYQ